MRSLIHFSKDGIVITLNEDLINTGIEANKTLIQEQIGNRIILEQVYVDMRQERVYVNALVKGVHLDISFKLNTEMKDQRPIEEIGEIQVGKWGRPIPDYLIQCVGQVDSLSFVIRSMDNMKIKIKDLWIENGNYKIKVGLL